MSHEQKHAGWEAAQTPIPQYGSGGTFSHPMAHDLVNQGRPVAQNGRTALRFRIAFLHCFLGFITEFIIPSACRMCQGGLSR